MLRFLLALSLTWAITGCGDDRPIPDGGPDGEVDVAPGDVTVSDTNEDAPPLVGPLVIGTWNLRNFSVLGPDEGRIDNLADTIRGLNVDLLAVQEIKVQDDTEGEPPQAWDVLVEDLDVLEGVHNPWNTFDTTVGLLYRPDVVQILDMRTLFPMDRSAFPRPPLEVTAKIRRDGIDVTVRIIVLHLKAFEEGLPRRRAACANLKRYVDANEDGNWIIIGDFNDDPYDPEDLNTFSQSFLNAEPDYHFLTATLPPESVTSTGWFHYVGDEEIVGEFLDHIIVTGPLYDTFSFGTPTIHSMPESAYNTWQNTNSDHFPVTVTVTP